MQKIYFNDHYGLTQAVIEGRKIMSRWIITPQPDFLSDNFGWAKRNNGDVILPKYGVGEIVAVAQKYSTIAAEHPDVDTFLLQVAKAHKIPLEIVQDLAGWNNSCSLKRSLYLAESASPESSASGCRIFRTRIASRRALSGIIKPVCFM